MHLEATLPFVCDFAVLLALVTMFSRENVTVPLM